MIFNDPSLAKRFNLVAGKTRFPECPRGFDVVVWVWVALSLGFLVLFCFSSPSNVFDG